MKINKGTPDQMLSAMKAALAGSQVDEVESATDIVVEDSQLDDNYVSTLIESANAKIEDADLFSGHTWEMSDDSDSIYLTAMQGDVPVEYTIPLADLSLNTEDIDKDVDYIMSAISPEDTVEGASSIEGAYRDDDYYGKYQAEEYGDLICKNLKGKTVSKKRYGADEPGGLVYEAKKLGIDMWDMLGALEGLCYQGRAEEVDDSTYLVTCSSDISASEKVTGKNWEELIHNLKDAGYDVDGADTRSESAWVTLYKDGKSFEGEVTKYSDGAFEIMDYNIRPITATAVVAWDDWYDDDDEDDSEWIRVASKSVPDSDGFNTDYTMYQNAEDGSFIFMFGDADVYRPDRDYADYECESEEEAWEWFDDYSGIDDDVYSSTDVKSSANIIWPWKMVGTYQDGYEAEVGGWDESDCMHKLISKTSEHGDLTYYTGVSDEDYSAGEYIGEENFIYD